MRGLAKTHKVVVGNGLLSLGSLRAYAVRAETKRKIPQSSRYDWEWLQRQVKFSARE